MERNHKRSVIVTDPEGRETEYSSQSEAARAIGMGQSEVSKICRGVFGARRGYRIRFKEDSPSLPAAGQVLPMRSHLEPGVG